MPKHYWTTQPPQISRYKTLLNLLDLALAGPDLAIAGLDLAIGGWDLALRGQDLALAGQELSCPERGPVPR